MKAENARFDYSKELQIENKKSVKEKKKVQYNATELGEILARHKHWLDEDCEGWTGMRANFEGADLEGANLRGADLNFASFEGANLRGADLREACLGGADFTRADLQGAILQRANLSGVDFTKANLWRANLQETELGGAYIRGADLEGAFLQGAKNVPFIPMACPDTGAFVGWKKADGCIVKLFIPEDAKRSSSTGRKCRCDKAVVLSIEGRNGKVHDKPEEDFYAISDHDANFIYRVGETVSVDNFCEDRFIECAPGIHFFINKQEAIEYI